VYGGREIKAQQAFHVVEVDGGYGETNELSAKDCLSS